MLTSARAAALAGVTALSTLSASSRAATTIDPGEVGGQVWTAAGNPYAVKGEEGVTVSAGTELRIEPGVVVTFERSSRGIQVAGTLIVNGTAAAPVVLQGTNATFTPSAWGGIRATRCAPNGCAPTLSAVVKIRGALIKNAANGVLFEAPADVSIDATTFESCDVGLSVGDVPGSGKSYRFDAITSQSCNVGIRVTSASVTLTNALLVQNATRGVASQAAALTIINSTFVANKVGVGGWQSAGVSTLDIENSIFSINGRSIAVEAGPEGIATLQVAHSTFSFNDVNLSVHTADQSEELAGTMTPPGPGNAVADPRFQTTFDVHLSEGSPCIDSADPTRAPLHDLDGAPRPQGAGVDRGAFEFGSGAGAAGMTGGGGGASASGSGGVSASGGGVSATGSGGGSGSGGGGGSGSGGGVRAGAGGASGGRDGTGVAIGSGGSPWGSSGGGTGGNLRGATTSNEGCGCQVGAAETVSSSLSLLFLLSVTAFGRRRARR